MGEVSSAELARRNEQWTDAQRRLKGRKVAFIFDVPAEEDVPAVAKGTVAEVLEVFPGLYYNNNGSLMCFTMKVRLLTTGDEYHTNTTQAIELLGI